MILVIEAVVFHWLFFTIEYNIYFVTICGGMCNKKKKKEEN